MTLTFRALGTTGVIATGDPARLGDACAAVERELSAIDRACSRFRPDSELVRVNRAGGERTAIGPVLLEALRVALDAARSSGGLVDPTVGRTLRTSGYDSTFRVVAARDGDTFRAEFCTVPGWETIELDEVAATVRVPAGVELDLGATAKALACDRAAGAAAAVVGSVLVSLGGDIAIAGPAPVGGWPVRIADDHAAPLDGPGPRRPRRRCAAGAAAAMRSTISSTRAPAGRRSRRGARSAWRRSRASMRTLRARRRSCSTMRLPGSRREACLHAS